VLWLNVVPVTVSVLTSPLLLVDEGLKESPPPLPVAMVLPFVTVSRSLAAPGAVVPPNVQLVIVVLPATICSPAPPLIVPPPVAWLLAIVTSVSVRVLRWPPPIMPEPPQIVLLRPQTIEMPEKL